MVAMVVHAIIRAKRLKFHISMVTAYHENSPNSSEVAFGVGPAAQPVAKRAGMPLAIAEPRRLSIAQAVPKRVTGA